MIYSKNNRDFLEELWFFKELKLLESNRVLLKIAKTFYTWNRCEMPITTENSQRELSFLKKVLDFLQIMSSN